MAVAVRRPVRSATPYIMRRAAPVPVTELEELHQQLDALMGSVLPPGVAEAVRPWIPAVDIEETEDAWIVEAEAPGAKRDDIHVEVRDNELAITGEIKERERKGILRRRTRRVGEFEFRVTLPGQADTENIQASIDDGVLSVTVPKADRAQSRRIEIHDGHAGNGAGAPEAAGATEATGATEAAGGDQPSSGSNAA